MEKENKNTDYTALLKVSLPLSQNTYEEMDDALKNDKINWEDLSKDLKQAYNRFGLEYIDYHWNEMLVNGQCHGMDYIGGIEDNLKFFQLMNYEDFESKQDLYNAKQPLREDVCKVFIKGLNEGFLQVKNCPKEVKKAYEEILQMKREKEKMEREAKQKDYTLLQNIKLPLSQSSFVELMGILRRGHIKRSNISNEIQDACQKIDDKFWE